MSQPKIMIKIKPKQSPQGQQAPAQASTQVPETTTVKQEEPAQAKQEEPDQAKQDESVKQDEMSSKMKCVEIVLAFRVECYNDLLVILNNHYKLDKGFIGGYTCTRDEYFIDMPDYDVKDFKLRAWVRAGEKEEEVMLDTLLSFIKCLEDGQDTHVAHQSLDLQSEYTGERDFALEEEVKERGTVYIAKHMTVLHQDDDRTWH